MRKNANEMKKVSSYLSKHGWEKYAESVGIECWKKGEDYIVKIEENLIVGIYWWEKEDGETKLDEVQFWYYNADEVIKFLKNFELKRGI